MSTLYEVAGFLLSEGREHYAKEVLASAEREEKLALELNQARVAYSKLEDAVRQMKRPGPALRALLTPASTEPLDS